MRVRPLTAQDGAIAAEIFHDAVLNGTADVYSLDQRRAWAGPSPNRDGWTKRFADISGFAAEEAGIMVGFMTLDDSGYIDLAFVRPDFAGQGCGRRLYDRIEVEARRMGLQTLTTEASKMARPFFERMGWQVEQAQTVTKADVTLINYKMSKRL